MSWVKDGEWDADEKFISVNIRKVELGFISRHANVPKLGIKP